ncbi:MAG: hypothetical protein R3E97_07470 [Candidatus Eisenbacteria bacterium]
MRGPSLPPNGLARAFAEDPHDEMVVTGSGAMHALIKEGAATLCF